MLDEFGIYILLVAAVAAGWVLGRLGRSTPGKTTLLRQDLFADYFVGLNYLLNDEPDEAIDTFIKALEINSETIETHLALGALLRRRGKVDKAIKVHQTLLARPGLEQEFSDATRLQLSMDYVSAGLLDRAERLLKDVLAENSLASQEALKHLITIYQTEKEWEKAIQCCSQLLATSAYKKDKGIRTAAAHYCCEIAEGFLSQGQSNMAREQVKRAFGFNRKSVRASLLLARIEQQSGNTKAAIKELLRIRTNSPEFIGQILPPLSECYEKNENIVEFGKLLSSFYAEAPSVSLLVALSENIALNEGEVPALAFLQREMLSKPSLAGMRELLKLQSVNTDENIAENLRLLLQMIDTLLQKKPAYQCQQCGYEARNLYWLCPSCQKWDEIKPIEESAVF